jgi:type II secretory pathway predicted ATPase ExeA
MSRPVQQLQAMPEHAPGVPQPAILSSRHQAALGELQSMLEENISVVQLAGVGEMEVRHVAAAFMNSSSPCVSQVRLCRTYSDGLPAMQDIVTGFGFDPKDFQLSDLRNIVLMFLDYQRKHALDAVIWVDQPDDQPQSVLNVLHDLVTLKERNDLRLTILLTGGTEKARFDGAQTISLAPLNVPQTREFIEQRLAVSGYPEPSRLFDPDAISRLRRLSGGNPDQVARLCHECLRMTNKGSKRAVSAKCVVKAARRLKMEQPTEQALGVVQRRASDKTNSSGETITIKRNGAVLHRFILKQGRFLVGRARSADICLPSSLVSRRHALIIRTASILQVLDLGSTNGTQVKGRKIGEYTIQSGDVLQLGDFQLQYQNS